MPGKKPAPETPAAAAAREAARRAFAEAAAGSINPSELGRKLRHLMSDPESFPGTETGRQIQQFVDLDLSDYAYSLALHDQPAITALHDDIKQWAQRLGEGPAEPCPEDAPKKPGRKKK